jgi:hypothetical protein
MTAVDLHFLVFFRMFRHEKAFNTRIIWCIDAL